MRLMDEITQQQLRFYENEGGYPEYLLVDKQSFERLKKEYILEMSSEISELGLDTLSVQDLSEVLGVTICLPISKITHGFKLLKEA